MPPSVSIILPTYNREKFLPEAFDAIKSQTTEDWELIVIDDGSTDNTQKIVEQWQQTSKQHIRYVWRENSGAYAARNQGLDLAAGKYIAFYDSDDLWTKPHLSSCLEILKSHSDVDWVFGYLTRIDFDSGQVKNKNNFYHNDGTPTCLLTLQRVERGRAWLIEDKRLLEYAINPGLPCGVHSAVIRSSVFNKYRFDERYRNGQDRFGLIHAINKAAGIAYLEEQHLLYRIHDQNDSLVQQQLTLTKREAVTLSLTQQYIDLSKQIPLSRSEAKKLFARISNNFFWGLGYHVYFAQGRYLNALLFLAKGIYFAPSNWRLYKSFAGIAAEIALTSLNKSKQQSHD